MTTFEIYKALWATAEQIGPENPKRSTGPRLYVHEKCVESESSAFNPGYVTSEIKVGPSLQIHNPSLSGPTRKPQDDGRVLIKLITLAHEAGHATSWHTNAGCAWRDYFRAINHRHEVQSDAIAALPESASVEDREIAAIAKVRAELTSAERDLIWDEENRAWEIGKELLSATPFDDWDAFEKRRALTLRSHQIRLGMIEPEPGELAKRPSDFE